MISPTLVIVRIKILTRKLFNSFTNSELFGKEYDGGGGILNLG